MKKLLLIIMLTISSLGYAKELKTINLVLPAGPGGVSTKVGLLLQEKLKDDYNVVLTYKPGAGGIIAANYVAEQKTKDITLLFGTSGIVEGSFFNKNTARYDVEKDFIIIKNLGVSPMVLVVANNDSALSVKDLLNESYTYPISYGSSNVGGAQHISAAIVTNQFKNTIHVPYKSGGDAIVGILAGSIRFVVESPMVVDPLIKDGRLRPLAVLYNSRLPIYKQVPTFSEIGINDYGYKRWFVLLANSSANLEDVNIIKHRLSDPAVTRELEKLDLYNSNQPINTTFLINQTQKFKKITENVKFE